MKDEIIKELLKLEKRHEIKILYAVESGSRAWGFAKLAGNHLQPVILHKSLSRAANFAKLPNVSGHFKTTTQTDRKKENMFGLFKKKLPDCDELFWQVLKS